MCCEGVFSKVSSEGLFSDVFCVSERASRARVECFCEGLLDCYFECLFFRRVFTKLFGNVF